MSELDETNIDNTNHGITAPEDIEEVITTSQSVIPEHIAMHEPVAEPELAVTVEPNPLAPIVSEIIQESLVDLVKKSLENEEMNKKISITLTPEVITIINNIISLSPNTLTDIEKAAVEIIKDGKIDSKDVPNIVVIIQRIYQFIYSSKNVKFDTKKRADVTATTLKYILHFLVLERKIKIDQDKQEEFFTQTDLLIDSCISLLSYSKSLQTKGCLKKLFG